MSTVSDSDEDEGDIYDEVYNLEELESEYNTTQLMSTIEDPDKIDGDIYDEVYNLEQLQSTLSGLLLSNDISQEEFDSEMLKTTYYLDVLTKTYILEQDDAIIIEELRKSKEFLNEQYRNSKISEEEFNKNYIIILRKEHTILKMSEVEDGNKIKYDLDLPLEQKLELLHQEEIKKDKSIAKKNGILYPKLPSGITKDEINHYYNLKITGDLKNEDTQIEEYLKKYSATKRLIDYYTTSYEVTKIFYDADDKMSRFVFKMVPPLSSKLGNIKSGETRLNLLNPEEQAYSERLVVLKNRLRQLRREDLIKCASVRMVKFMSYIERLRENKQTVIKFRSNPEDYLDLKKIIEEDNIYYQIPSSELFKAYTYARPDVFNLTADDIFEKIDAIKEYIEKGDTGYLAVKEGADIFNLNDDDYITVLPLKDELYTMLKAQSGDKTEIAQAWELRMSLPGSNLKNIVKRYISFEDYLKDFKQILIENSKSLTGKSKDVINAKLRKISYYLKYQEDPDIYLPTGHTSISDTFKNRVEIYGMRQEGLYDLLEFITTYYPGSTNLVEKLEADIFDYSSSNYKFNIQKILFILNNHPEKLQELVENQISIIELLTYETPKTLPEIDIDMRDPKEDNINKLLNWKVNTDQYNIYESELNDSNHDFEKFKKENVKLSTIEVSQIMSQYAEKTQWSRSLEKYQKLEFPDGALEFNFRLRYLLKERNKLGSRRVFILASVSERMENQDKLIRTFRMCNLPEPKKYASLTENIVFGLSKTPEYYKYYINLVNTEYNKLCDYFTRINLKCELEPDGNVKCITPFDPEYLIPIITEFLVTQGEIGSIDIARLKAFTETINSYNVLDYIRSLRGDELDAYYDSISGQLNQNKTPLNEIYKKATKILKAEKFRIQLNEISAIIYSTYKPPIISKEKPVKIKHGMEYTQDYIKIGDDYIYGGFYPMFTTYARDGSIISQNYTRIDLEQLAGIYDIELEEDSFELYKKIMKFISDYKNKNAVIVKKNFNPIYNETFYEYLKVPTRAVMYTYRPRIGVQEPGEVYSVTKDPVKIYGVPFDFTENTFPIYSQKLKERVDNGFIVIEGPCVFKETDDTKVITSDSYINVEYKDSRGKSKMFREGVSTKNIMKRKVDTLNTCTRFTLQQTCDDPNSYSLDVNGLKFKCKWINEKCTGIIVEPDELKNFNVSEISFEDNDLNELWQTAIDKSIKYVEELTKLKELTLDEIKILTKEQKSRLFAYYKTLIKPNKTLQVIQEEVIEDRGLSIIEEFSDILNPKNVVVQQQRRITEGYTSITVYELTEKTRSLPLKSVILENEYIINGDIVIPKEYKSEEQSYSCELKKSGVIILVNKNEFQRKSAEIIAQPVPIFCFIKNEDLPFLNLPGYYWYEKKQVYLPVGDKLIKNEENIKKYKVPSNFIKPNKESLLNGKPLISRQDILNAISDTAFSTLSSEDSFIYNVINKVNATKDAIDFAVKNKIDINGMFSKIVGTISLPDVLEEYESKNTKSVMSKTQLINIMTAAIDKQDKKELIKYFVMAKKAKIDKEIINAAKELIKTIKDEPPPEPEPPPPIPPAPTPARASNPYLAKARRR
tara:strand:- start:3028 stop:7791 length:4764 start_codon:yes stop_codon:yes gene_type:complete